MKLFEKFFTLCNDIHAQVLRNKAEVERVNESLVNIENQINKLALNISIVSSDLCLKEQNNEAQISLTLKELKSEIKEVKEKLWSNDQEPNQNIRKHLFFYAGQETARYIIANMNKVHSLNKPLDILPYAIEKANIKGLFLEFGVYSGSTINCIAQINPQQIVYGFDSFEGLPEAWRSGFEKGMFKKDEFPEVQENVRLIKGWFHETLPIFIKNHSEQCAFIHIDCDLYSSTMTVFQILANQIGTGTVIVFDEYFNYPGWKDGEFKAFQVFVEEHRLSYEYIAYVDSLEQVAVRIL